MSQKGNSLVTLILIIMIGIIIVTATYSILFGETGVINQIIEEQASDSKSSHIVETTDENVNIVIVNDL